MGILCVTVDLDEIRSYHDIHGLDAPPGHAADLIYRVALSRVAEFLGRLGVAGTLFIVGRDLMACRPSLGVISDLARAGHEIGNHTMEHRYDLTLLPSDQQRLEIEGGAAAVREATGASPAGFRAPGYNVHLGLLDVAADCGCGYDSSVFACPAYVAAKAAAIGAKKLAGLESRSVVGDPRVLLAPTEPYRLGRDGVWTRGEGMLELPISVVTRARIPFVGTFLTMMGKTAARLVARRAAGLGFVNLELHGIDFVDARADGVEYLARHQPDLRIPLSKKTAVLERVVSGMLDAGMQAMTLLDASRRVLV